MFEENPRILAVKIKDTHFIIYQVDFENLPFGFSR